jgi:hypothetical protein
MNNATLAHSAKWLTEQLAVNGRTRARLHDEISALTLRQAARPDAKTDAEIDQLETALAAEERKFTRLTLATQGHKTAASAEARAERIAANRGRVAEIDELEKEMRRLAKKLIAHAEGFGPLLAMYERAGQERRARARIVLQDADDPFLSSLRGWYAHEATTSLKEGPASVALNAALWRSGLGRVGLNLSSHLELRSPDWSGPYAADKDITAGMVQSLDQLKDRLNSGLARALASMEPQPE